MENLAEKEQVLDVARVVDPRAVAMAKEIIKLKGMLDANKPLYDRLEHLTLELKSLNGTDPLEVTLTEEERMFMHNGVINFLAPNQIVTVVDNFSEKNTVFRPAAVKRFEVKSETTEEYLAKEAKKSKAKKA